MACFFIIGTRSAASSAHLGIAHRAKPSDRPSERKGADIQPLSFPSSLSFGGKAFLTWHDGVITMPPRSETTDYREDVMYGVLRDELDVQYVLGVRIEGLPVR